MFTALLVIGSVMFMGGFIIIILRDSLKKIKRPLAGMMILGIFCMMTSFFTEEGNIRVHEIVSETQYGSWLIIDNECGSMRHWVLENGYLGKGKSIGGWIFYRESAEKPSYVGSRATIIYIHEPMLIFLKTYKAYYGIPENNIALK